ncbi:MAG: hypothetical protein COB17_10825 [Sulfurimonas sp.]|nr:MAG: hypothetical protein COB17_10825 [Sulfurimonas sp.]
MKKLLTVVFSIAVLTFCGCAGKSEVKAATEVGQPADDAAIPTYFRGAYMSVEDAESKLSAAGFEVVATYKSTSDAKTIVFTCPTLKKEAAKPKRTFMAALRVFIDEKTKILSVQNPVYFGKAYMGKDFSYKIFSAVQAKLLATFTNLKPSEENLEYDDLADYRYTIMNPRYNEPVTLTEGTYDDIMSRLKKKKTVFKIELGNNSALIAYKLGGSTKRFTKKTGLQNAILLPYPIAITEGKATMLHGEYYIALHYPDLGMITFGTIALIPGAINDDLKKAFKKTKKKK